MDIRELRKLVSQSQSVVVVENGEPLFVVMGYQAYLNLGQQEEVRLNRPPTKKVDKPGLRPLFESDPEIRIQSRESEILDRLNKEIQALKEQIALEDEGLVQKTEELEV